MVPARIRHQIDVVIEAARTAQEEAHGPDSDYRRWANEDVQKERAKLITMIEALVENR